MNPPSAVFAPIWTVLYVLMGVAAAIVWRHGLGRAEVRKALIVFVVQLGANALWSVLFFGLQNPLLALIDFIALWLFVVWTTVLFARVSKPAASFLVLYLLWVTFAGYLNAAIVLLN